MISGRVSSAPVAPAARSSSVKNGLPAARRTTASTSPESGHPPDDRLELAADVSRGQPFELDADDPGDPLHLGEPRPQRMAPMQFIAAVGRHDQNALGPQAPGEEGDDVARRAIRPVEVLDEEDHGLDRPEPLEEREQAFEDAGLGPVRSTVRGLVDHAPELRARGSRVHWSRRRGSRPGRRPAGPARLRGEPGRTVRTAGPRRHRGSRSRPRAPSRRWLWLARRTR